MQSVPFKKIQSEKQNDSAAFNSKTNIAMHNESY